MWEDAAGSWGLHGNQPSFGVRAASRGGEAAPRLGCY